MGLDPRTLPQRHLQTSSQDPRPTLDLTPHPPIQLKDKPPSRQELPSVHW